MIWQPQKSTTNHACLLWSVLYLIIRSVLDLILKIVLYLILRSQRMCATLVNSTGTLVTTPYIMFKPSHRLLMDFIYGSLIFKGAATMWAQRWFTKIWVSQQKAYSVLSSGLFHHFNDGTRAKDLKCLIRTGGVTLKTLYFHLTFLYW